MKTIADSETSRLQGGLERLLRGEASLTLNFQAIVDLRRGGAVGYEALVRFPEELGPDPESVFYAADALGLQVALEALVVRTVLAARVRVPPDCFFSMNVSPIFLLSAEWDHILSEVPDLAGMVVEITEQSRVHDYNVVRRKLERIRAKGGMVAIDDTGSGYASLKHVTELRPNFIKLDRFFVSGCHLEPAKLSMIEMIGQAANRLDAWIIAEGIELEMELVELIRLSVPLGQGYLFGRPSPEMHLPSPETRRMICSRAKPRAARIPVSEEAERCAVSQSVQEAQELLTKPTTQTVVVIDKWERPIQILHRHALVGIHMVSDVMRVQSTSDLQEVLERALNRPTRSRFEPLAVINERGEFTGVLEVDRMMRAALSKPSHLKPLHLKPLPSAAG